MKKQNKDLNDSQLEAIAGSGGDTFPTEAERNVVARAAALMRIRFSSDERRAALNVGD